jgi:hypothetical protein
MQRRDFFHSSAAGLFGTMIPFSASSAPSATAPQPKNTTGEPYELGGKRIVFANWYFVRPGSFGWYDDSGKSVAVVGDQDGWGAHIKNFDRPHGIRLAPQSAERLGPIIQPEFPWEEKGTHVTTLLRDGDRFRAWGGSAGEGGSFFATWESRDGIQWERPKLGFVDYQGSKENNLLGTKGSHGTVFIDPSAPDEERYKWVGEESISSEEFEAFKTRRPDAWESRCVRTDVNQVFGVRGGVSPDGLRWTFLPEPLVVEHSDTQVTAYYDERLQKYVCYTRNWMVGPRSDQVAADYPMTWLNVGRRSIGRSESADFRNLPLSQVILEPGPELAPSDVLYTNTRTSVPGAPEHHLMFPAIWHTHNDTTSHALASSHDGRLWHFLPGPPVLETPAFGEWDGGCIFARPNLVELPDGRWVLPYTGYNFPHKYPRGKLRAWTGYAVWPHGRLVALEAVDEGEFATVAIIPPTGKLRLNVRTMRGGSVLVEAVGLDGRTLPGRGFEKAIPIIGDHPSAPVAWQGAEDFGEGAEKGVFFRFRMREAEIFGLDFV